MDFPAVNPHERDPGYLVLPSTVRPPEADSDHRDDDGDLSADSSFKRILEMLMEEETMEEGSGMLVDPLALQAAEKSFSDVLGEKYPPSRDQLTELPCPDNSSHDDSFGSDRNAVSGSIFQSISQMPFSSVSSCCLGVSFDGIKNPSVSTLLHPNSFGADETISLQPRSVGEVGASKYFPCENLSIIDLENSALPPMLKNDSPHNEVEKNTKRENLQPIGARERKDQLRKDIDTKESRKKQLIAYEEEYELLELFDKVFVSCDDHMKPPVCNCNNEVSRNKQQLGYNGRKDRAKHKRNIKQEVDFRSLLLFCARAISINDDKNVDKTLKEIRQHASPFGDGSQRVAHYFANALEARLVGTGSQIFASLSSDRPSTTDQLKAYQSFLSACPFKRINFSFSNHYILNLAKMATKLHIIDFGILCGFQWPVVIQTLSQKLGGPPKLRITGIEIPHPIGPAKKVEETGHILAQYCKRFNVPFEYNGIAQKWETIQIEDLKIDDNEIVIVNCLHRLEYLLDETIMTNCPRDILRELIRKIKPHIFIHGIINGSFNSPFFVTRFHEALFHYSSLFDMLDTTLPHENEGRLLFEKEFYGREIINVVACEGLERIVRPLPYKLWQKQNISFGFKQLPLDRELIKTLRAKVKAGYHKDFAIDEDDHWMLHRWRGRIMLAISCWV
ncbi:scarecrow-like protein 14 [Malania oleifera]|uniref:scarecrow-like protein 14 n=1 Tax=Malania oleifera TaxID=397392 RepID=UPI0025ADB208|nr:scarecrow-like protein 14 [Malania oleifera]